MTAGNEGAMAANTLDAALQFLLEREWRRRRKRQALHKIIDNAADPDAPELRRLIAEEQARTEAAEPPDADSRYLVIDRVHRELREELNRATGRLWPDSREERPTRPTECGA